MMYDLIYDIEVYPNITIIGFYDPKYDRIVNYEISEWKDEWQEFIKFLFKCENNFTRWVGFNNFYYDYQVLHKLITHQPFHTMENKFQFIYKISDYIIKMSKEDRINKIVWANEHIIPQIDLFRIHHFDNMARATSLKKLEFNMRSHSIKDLPFKPSTIINKEQRQVLIKYNIHDLRETAKFYEKSKDMIKFREELSNKYDKNFINHNDTKIGKDYFIMKLQNANIKCFNIKDNKRVPIQTKRPCINIKDIIFPYIKFLRPEFNAVLHWLKQQTITTTKGVFTEIDDLGVLEQYANLKKIKGKFKNLNCIVDGFQFDFGTGGIHGSIPANIVESNDYYAIIDYDVTSLYPSIAIVNKIYPEHLTSKFCDIYDNMRKQRLSYAKGTPENAMLKLALNGVYGDSNNPFSPFYDPQYTMTITINGQLMLCMLAEMMIEKIEGLSLIQINTDGVTIKVPRKNIDYVENINKQWEVLTGLQLERADYSKMFIRDVNNYIGLYTDGKVKRKGAYEYNVAWHQNHSALVVRKAVEEFLVRNVPIKEYILNHKDVYDFMLRTNIPKSSRLLIEYDDYVEELQNITRYYISDSGGKLTKIMPPLKQTPSLVDLEARATTPAKIRDFNIIRDRRIKLGVADKERIINIEDGFKVVPMNEMGEVKDINYQWYIDQAHELIKPLMNGVLNDLICL